MEKRFIIVALILLSGCSQITKPVPFGLYKGMRDGAPEGTDTFRSGWKDGCESGLASNGLLTYKKAYKYKYDELMLENQEYFSSWRVGFRYCRWYVTEWTRQDNKQIPLFQ